MNTQALKDCLVISLIIAGLVISLSSHAASEKIGTFNFEANYSSQNSQLTISVNNTSNHRDDTMRCLTLPDINNGVFRITNSPRDGWFFPDSVSACAVFSNQFIHSGDFKFQVNADAIRNDSLKVSYLSRSDRRYTGTLQISGLSSPNNSPVADAGPDQVINDTDGISGEYVELDASGSFDDNAIVSYQWYTGNRLLATGKNASVFLEDDSNSTIELVVEDNEGALDSDFVEIFIAPFTASYNGVSPDPFYQLGLNNIGIYDADQKLLFLCVRMHSDTALTQSEDGKVAFNLTLSLSNTKPLRFNIVKQSIFNPDDLLNEYGQAPDCSGDFDGIDRVLTDTIQLGSLIGKINLVMDDAPIPTLTLFSFEWLEFVVR